MTVEELRWALRDLDDEVEVFVEVRVEDYSYSAKLTEITGPAPKYNDNSITLEGTY